MRRHAGKVGPQTKREWVALLTEEGLTTQAAGWFLTHVVHPEGLTPLDARLAALEWVLELRATPEKAMRALADGAIIQ